MKEKSWMLLPMPVGVVNPFTPGEYADPCTSRARCVSKARESLAHHFLIIAICKNFETSRRLLVWTLNFEHRTGNSMPILNRFYGRFLKIACISSSAIYYHRSSCLVSSLSPSSWYHELSRQTTGNRTHSRVASASMHRQWGSFALNCVSTFLLEFQSSQLAILCERVGYVVCNDGRP